jgi:hypothetical protein
MKLFIFFVVSSHALALEITFVNPVVGNRSEATFQKVGEKIILTKKSNFYDQKDLSLGNFKLDPVLSKSAALTELVDMAEKVKKTEEVLKSANASLNLQKRSHHGPRYVVDELVVGPGTSLFADLDNAFKNVVNLDWKLHTGVKIDLNTDQFQFITDGKVVKEESFRPARDCRIEGQKTICDYKSWGVLNILERKK